MERRALEARRWSTSRLQAVYGPSPPTMSSVVGGTHTSTSAVYVSVMRTWAGRSNTTKWISDWRNSFPHFLAARWKTRMWRPSSWWRRRREDGPKVEPVVEGLEHSTLSYPSTVSQRPTVVHSMTLSKSYTIFRWSWKPTNVLSHPSCVGQKNYEPPCRFTLRCFISLYTQKTDYHRIVFTSSALHWGLVASRFSSIFFSIFLSLFLGTYILAILTNPPLRLFVSVLFMIYVFYVHVTHVCILLRFYSRGAVDIFSTSLVSIFMISSHAFGQFIAFMPSHQPIYIHTIHTPFILTCFPYIQHTSSIHPIVHHQY